MPAFSRMLFERTWFNALRTIIYAAGFLVFFAWLALALRAFDTSFSFAWPRAVAPFGILLMFFGSILATACIVTFVVRGRGTPALFDPPRQFVAIGPYRYVRNPMYIGGFTLLLGLACGVRSISILLMVIALVPVVHLLVVLHEEPSLKRKFGGDYENYLRAVARWLPRPPRAAAKPNSASLAS